MIKRPNKHPRVSSYQAAWILISLLLSLPASAQVLDKQKLLEAQTFWDNRDWDWYKQQIPFLETPEPSLDTTYYYRWELVTKHLTYGSPTTGYVFTEFIDRPFWSGTYGAISCPAGHQLYEVRWLKDPRFARDYARYWFRTPGAQPRRYSCWLADAIWAVHQVHPDDAFVTDLLPDLEANYKGWEQTNFVPEVGLFWQTGHDDGMEININSRQTHDTVRGAPAYRPTLNAYLWADAHAIAKVARIAGRDATATSYTARADRLKANMQKQLWDPSRTFFFPRSKQDEENDGHVVKALSLTYQTGRFAGDPHGRELIGYVPWAFGMVDDRFAPAWQYLMDPDRFFAPFGPTVTERHDPLFAVTKTCCWWSGQSWPYATTQTLVGLANLLNTQNPSVITKADYVKLLLVYAQTHRKNGRPYIAEGVNPDTGSWEGYDSYNHSEHYFHSGFADLVVTGLAGLRPRADDVLEVNPLIPEDWPYFALDEIRYHGRRVAVLWDRDGTRYGFGKGLHVLVDGKVLASSPTVGKQTITLESDAKSTSRPPWLMNYAVNNDGTRFPRVSASFARGDAPPAKVNDGNYWYHRSPPNRWSSEGSSAKSDWLTIDFGTSRRIHTIKLYLIDDGEALRPPAHFELEFWNGTAWQPIPGQSRAPEAPAGRRANVVRFAAITTRRIRALFTHADGARTGISEFEAWGDADPAYAPPPPPEGNLALNTTGQGYPSATASFTSSFDQVAMVNDGRVVFSPTPHNRWTSYQSPNATDWVAIDFGGEREVAGVDLHVYDDGGGVQAPERYTVQYADSAEWRDVPGQQKTPINPVGGQVNSATFPTIRTGKIRVLFTHKGTSRSGLTEIEIWKPSERRP